jgi:hypothetical protein
VALLSCACGGAKAAAKAAPAVSECDKPLVVCLSVPPAVGARPASDTDLCPGEQLPALQTDDVVTIAVVERSPDGEKCTGDAAPREVLQINGGERLADGEAPKVAGLVAWANVRVRDDEGLRVQVDDRPRTMAFANVTIPFARKATDEDRTEVPALLPHEAPPAGAVDGELSVSVHDRSERRSLRTVLEVGFSDNLFFTASHEILDDGVQTGFGDLGVGAGLRGAVGSHILLRADFVADVPTRADALGPYEGRVTADVAIARSFDSERQRAPRIWAWLRSGGERYRQIDRSVAILGIGAAAVWPWVLIAADTQAAQTYDDVGDTLRTSTSAIVAFRVPWGLGLLGLRQERDHQAETDAFVISYEIRTFLGSRPARNDPRD